MASLRLKTLVVVQLSVWFAYAYGLSLSHSSEFDCGNGNTVPQHYLCDGDDDCRNGADERNCSRGNPVASTTETPVLADRFDCGNGNTVSQSFLCNGDDDCRNGADERNCSHVEFYCGNGRIIHQQFLCNGDDNCGNGADERICRHVQFDCGNGRVTHQHFLCNGDDNCGNGADERNCSRVLSGRFNCGDGNVVSQNSRCDGHDNCRNGADERNCSPVLPNVRWTPESEGIVGMYVAGNLTLMCQEFPQNYPDNSSVFWNIRTNPGYRLKVTFVLRELEDITDCRANYLSLYDGHELSSPSLGVYRVQDEDELPEPTVTSYNAMILQFTKDSRINWKRYHLGLSAICGGNLVAQPTWNEIISHHIFFNPMIDVYAYLENISCDWIIKSTPEKNVKIIFTAFEVGTVSESSDAERPRQEVQVSGCENSNTRNCAPEENNGRDFVEIYDGPDDASMRIGKYAGYQIPPPTITSRSDALLIRFRSVDHSKFRGFSVLYQEV